MRAAPQSNPQTFCGQQQIHEIVVALAVEVGQIQEDERTGQAPVSGSRSDTVTMVRSVLIRNIKEQKGNRVNRFFRSNRFVCAMVIPPCTRHGGR